MTCVLAPPVSAQDSATLERYRPGESPVDDFRVARPVGQGHLRFGAGVSGSYAHNPLVRETNDGSGFRRTERIVTNHLSLNASFSLGLFDYITVFAALPVSAWMSGDDRAALSSAGALLSDGAGLGDVMLGTKLVAPFDSDTFGLALRASLSVPTAGTQQLRGDGFLSGDFDLLAEVRASWGLRVNANLGAKLRENASLRENVVFRDELTFALGAAMPVWQTDDERTHLDVHLQGFGSTPFDGAGERGQLGLEVLAGAKFFHESGVLVGLAGGAGLTPGFGTPAARAIVSLAYAMPASAPDGDADQDGIRDSQDACPNEPEDADSFEDADGCPDPDNDRDGILDASDGCPNDPEDVDSFEDADGCPDADNDRDGILDASDRCPNEPEDMDSFEDTDGCPDSDNDRDGILDTSDRCPNEPGVPAQQGCPDPDRDGDGIVDRLDNCPDEAGSGVNHGCRAAQRVVIEESRLVILEVVHFRTNSHVIEARSFPLLDNVGQVLNAHPNVGRVRVEGHTDSRGRRESNMQLSQRRAESIVEYLVTRAGVARERLLPTGFGPDRPIAPNATTAADHARNRRVEFHFLDVVEGSELRNNGPTSAEIDR